ncbi:transketolase [Eubacterium oxidoreducens]|uniref:Transketolase subunit A n=1 Tax=Eubacterium oxidoreducens TaxID=1732 RepID=A0A1G6B4C3_EUBOX|nr:transketolase [Eubacterium oxidoreducens]SDB15524.1 transketolase subunit A [Eubacterium oxidoreducens]
MNDLTQVAKRMRLNILKMAYECGTNAHLGGALSITDILAVLYGKQLKNLGNQFPYDEQDKFILSKGHAVLALYAALKEAGIMTQEDLDSFQADGSALVAHPVMNLSLGIESSNGSLGQGISMAVGLALAAKKKKKPYHTYVLIGNGESNEGIVWEALISAVHFGLDNLTIILDDNKIQSDGPSSEIMAIPNYSERLKAFGFQVIEIDGNQVEEVVAALETPMQESKPKCIVANTIKGKGVSFMEQDNTWHHNRLTQKQYEAAIEEIQG